MTSLDTLSKLQPEGNIVFATAKYAEVSRDPRVQARYESMRDAGESHNFAEMVACRAFPAVRTDAEFNRGRVNGNQFESAPLMGDHYRKAAEAAGVSTTGKHYMHGLAEFPGDPEAWVSDRHDVRAVAEKKGLRVSGAVNYEPPARRPVGDILIADDLVDREVDEIMSLDGGYRREDVAERVRALRTGAVDPNPLLVDDEGGDS